MDHASGARINTKTTPTVPTPCATETRIWTDPPPHVLQDPWKCCCLYSRPKYEPVPRFCCLSSSTKDQIVMVNGVSMENVHSNYTIQILKTCGKTANVVSTGQTPGLNAGAVAAA